MSRKAVIVTLGLLLIAVLAIFLYSTFSRPFNYVTEYEANALCMVRANGINPLYQACMEDYGY